MKRKTERRKRYNASMHEKRAFVRVHLAKELKEGAKTKKRSLLVNKGDTVKVMRGAHRGKSAKVQKVSHAKGLVYLEGISTRNARGTESALGFQPSNLVITSVKETPYRQKVMSAKGE
ncbi:50S ribosomal protein L24 [Candidatus Micrarchaeota archaeon]|nr:50S ribosomal protein L24 [Candidatus Micrarchaeota archaeon]